MLVSSLFEEPKLQANLIFSQGSSNIPEESQILKFDSFEKDFILNDEATFEYFKQKALLFSCQLFHKEYELYVFSDLHKPRKYYKKFQKYIVETYSHLSFRRLKRFPLNTPKEASLLNNVFTSHFVNRGFDNIKLIFANKTTNISLLICSLDKTNEETQQKLQRKELKDFIKKHFYFGCDMRIGDEEKICLLSENEKNLLGNKFDFFITYAKHYYPELFNNMKDSNSPHFSSINFFGEGRRENILSSLKKMFANFSNYLNFTIIVDYNLAKEVSDEKELLEKLFYKASKIIINGKSYCAINILVDYQLFEQLNSPDQKVFTTLFIKKFCELQEKNGTIYEILLEKILSPNEKKEFFKYDFDSRSKLFEDGLINFDVFPCYINSDNVRTSSTYTFNYIRKFKIRKNFSLFQYEFYSIDSESAEEEKTNVLPTLINNKSKKKEQESKCSNTSKISGDSSNDSKEVSKVIKKPLKQQSVNESSENKKYASPTVIMNKSNEKSSKEKEEGSKSYKPSKITKGSSNDSNEVTKINKKQTKPPKQLLENESMGSSVSSNENFLNELNKVDKKQTKPPKKKSENESMGSSDSSNEKYSKGTHNANKKQTKPTKQLSENELMGSSVSSNENFLKEVNKVDKKQTKTPKKKSENESMENSVSSKEKYSNEVNKKNKTQSKTPKKKSESESTGSNVSSNESNTIKANGNNNMIPSKDESEEERKVNNNQCKLSSQEKKNSHLFNSSHRSHTSEQKSKIFEQYEETKGTSNFKKVPKLMEDPKKEHKEKFPLATPNKTTKKNEQIFKSDDKKDIIKTNNVVEIKFKEMVDNEAPSQKKKNL